MTGRRTRSGHRTTRTVHPMRRTSHRTQRCLCVSGQLRSSAQHTCRLVPGKFPRRRSSTLSRCCTKDTLRDNPGTRHTLGRTSQCTSACCLMRRAVPLRLSRRTHHRQERSYPCSVCTSRACTARTTKNISGTRFHQAQYPSRMQDRACRRQRHNLLEGYIYRRPGRRCGRPATSDRQGRRLCVSRGVTTK